ncbi:MAG TPA: prenyltransferase/squalene oxidase repeat-containing protein [Bryobacteraceae bacterium]|nr:prenyltransferase/squalene oxidase repeat-containing protein [Bryobacteraceae bacterium]
MHPQLDTTLATLTRRLLASRHAAGHWEGCLASSALSTATAVIALHLTGRHIHAEAVRCGLEWLATTQNVDGGWGDTDRSISNISTTSLVWAAFAIAGPRPDIEDRTASWLRTAAGSLAPAALAAAIVRRYGNDRTFSVPILTVLALAGKLGVDGWSRVTSLPFELAALPQRWFHALGLPVVSYALPALIAIGQLRHQQQPTRNPVTRMLRNAARAPTLSLLDRLQPSSGGFLEAIPLTSFVVMSLAAAGQANHPVVARGIEFLQRVRRKDGSWAIDTNLATWVTTLSVNALGDAIDPAGQSAIAAWLLGQQGDRVHPYTLAAPGAWAWTDLPGGVPDADDTPGAILALHHLTPRSPAALAAAVRGVTWLADLQNRDGGIPTFCRGWSKLPFDRSSPDLTAHTILAWSAWLPRMPVPLRARIEAALRRTLDYLADAQTPKGGWTPLWFGNQYYENDENPVYGTGRVLIGLAGRPSIMVERGIQWLIAAQNQDGGWGGAPGILSTIEETSVALHACATHNSPATRRAIERGAHWLIENTASGTHTPASPIGFYFARLWYYEELYPLIFATAALRRVKARVNSV